MIRRFGLSLAAAVGVLVSAAVAPATASTVTMTDYSFAKGSQTVTITGPSGSIGTVKAGLFKLTTTAGDWSAFCVDIFNALKKPTTYQVGPLLAAGDSTPGQPPSITR
jgi:hypothetical protein